MPENHRLMIPEPLTGAKPIVFAVADGKTSVREAPSRALVNLPMIGRAVGGGLEVDLVFQTDDGPLEYRILGATLDGVLVCERVSRQQRRRRERARG